MKTGEIYRGMLSEAEDTMNCQMKEGIFCSSRTIIINIELLLLF
jgi:small nuclear ribonucleoprotein (snRNP)-like protein